LLTQQPIDMDITGSPLPTFHFNVDTLPAHHDAELPIVVPLGAVKWNDEKPAPFASIMAAGPGEKVSASTRSCLQVVNENGTLKFRDGAFWVEEGYPLIVSAVPFPQLSKALQMDRKEWWPLLYTKPGDKPYRQIKNQQEGDVNLNLPAKQFSTECAWRAILWWDKMNTKKLDWYLRFCQVMEAEADLNSDEVDKATNAFQRYCNKIGLRLNENINVELKLKALQTCLAFAHKAATGG